MYNEKGIEVKYLKAEEYKKLYESEPFKRQYTYDKNDLGVSFDEEVICFKIWSPFALTVTLNLYEDESKPAFLSVAMEKEEQGVWKYILEGYGDELYYDFTLNFDGELVKSADIWAKACGCNGERSVVVDLAKTNPDGWEKDKSPKQEREQMIYEMHIKDFSYDKTSGVKEEYRGKYKAFTLCDTTLNAKGKKPTCLNYLKELGVTHVQLMPIYDFASVDESKEEGQYNWGYDPLNYNIPEGSYSTNPYNAKVRIKELKELIMALHKEGIGVIMDVVYNHTYSIDSWFTRTVPHYYYRQFEDGTYSDGSQCGNDVACEREMCRNYIVQSVLYWAEEYHIDGFRFDLMGLLDVELLNEIRRKLDEIYGKGKILIYGEPWSADISPMEEGYFPSKKNNMHLLDENVGVFCDNIRDAIKGHVFYEDIPGFVNGGTGLEETILSAVSGWREREGEFLPKAPSQIVNYISAHDDLTLWDKLVVTMKPNHPFEKRDEEIVRAYKMAAAIYFTCQGRIFFLGGEEGARTKYGDSNSYQSSPEINKIDWERIYEYEDILNYYKGLIGFRKQMSGLTDKSKDAHKRIFNKEVVKQGVVTFSVENDLEDKWKTLLIFYNSTKKECQITLPDGEWDVLVDESSSNLWQEPKTAKGEQKIAPVSVKIFGEK